MAHPFKAPPCLAASVDLSLIMLLAAAGFVAAFVDSIVGGGGAISLPALLATGMPVHTALGTNKLAASTASGVASIQYLRAGTVQPRQAAALVPFALAGSVAGAAVVLRIHPAFVTGAVLAAMAAMALYVLARPRFGARERPVTAPLLAFTASALLALCVGFYDGFLGPGTGTLFIFGLIAFMGFGFLRAAALGRVLNFATNIAALAFFAWRGHVDLLMALPLLVAMPIGAYAGSRFGIRHGARAVRPLFVAVVVLLMGRLAWGMWAG